MKEEILSGVNGVLIHDVCKEDKKIYYQVKKTVVKSLSKSILASGTKTSNRNITTKFLMRV